MNSYLNLKEDVWDKDICSGCGACVAVCPVNNIYFKEDSPIKFKCELCACVIEPIDEIEYPVSAEFCKTTLYDVPCGACYNACPRTKEKSIPKVKNGMGPSLEIVPVKSKINIKNPQNGGAVTSILANAFDNNLIDGAILISEDKWTMEPNSYLATSKEEVLNCAGSRYSWNVPILRALKEAVMVKKLKKIAVVGTPCVINSVYQIMSSNNDLLKPFKDAIRLKIALFCFETYNYDKMLKILEENNINPWDISKMDILKGKLVILLNNGKEVKFKLDEIESAVRNGCNVCGDFTGIVADLSIGNVGTDKGHSTVIVRNKWGKGFLTNALNNNYIEIDDANNVNTPSIEKLVNMKKERLNK